MASIQIPRERLYTTPVLLLAAIVGVSFFGAGFVMPLRALYGRSVGATGVEIGLMASSFLLAGFLAAPLIGRLTDRLGAGNVLWAGVLAHALLVLAYIPVQDPILLIGLRALEGIAAAAAYPPARALMNRLAPATRQGEAQGMLASAQTAGILLGPVIGVLLASQSGYNAAFALASLPLVLGVAVALIFLPRRADTAATTSGAVAEGGWRVAFTRPLRLTYALQAALGMSGGVIITIWSLYMADRGASLLLIGLSYTTYALPSMLLTPLAGRFSDRVGRFWPLTLGFALFGLVWLAYGLPLTPITIIVISGLEGIPAALLTSSLGGLLADSTPANARGRAQANFSAAGTLGSLISSVLAGAVYASGPGAPFVVVGLIYLLIPVTLFLPALRRLVSTSHLRAAAPVERAPEPAGALPA
jgi:MFS transporter, DHA1 family, solute carrier family 18 (vesicular amine transporter), member 1/2